MNITICGIYEVSEYIDEVDCAISIVDPGYDFIRPAELYQLGEWLLELEFDDTWLEVSKFDDVFAHEDDIYAVIDFVEKCLQNGKEYLLIHCHQGISRSTAIAVAVYAYLGESCPYERVLKERYEARPNPYILELAAEILDVTLQG
jgi:predicted protein tyrosine phosphatase